MTNKTTKNGRTKVRKACESCRKRKIKCTGLQPCASCEAYNCPCIYSNRNSPTTATSNNNNKHNNTTANIDSMQNNIPSNGIKKKRMSSNMSNASSVNNSSISSFSSLNIISPDNNNLCKNNLDQKIKNNDNKNCDEFNKTGVYVNDINVETQLFELNNIVNNLKNVTKLLEERNNPANNDINSKCTSNDNIQQILNNANEQLSLLNKNWDPLIDSNKFELLENYNNNNSYTPRNEKISLETSLLKNKFSDQINITKYFIWNENKYELPKSLKENISNNNGGKSSPENNTTDNVLITSGKTGLIDEMFGLYSLFEPFSFSGIGQNCKKFIETCPSDENITKEVKEGIYLTLRFFDMCLSHFHENTLSVANPLESYLQMRNIKFLGPDSSRIDSPLNNSNSPINNNIHTPGTPSSSISSTNTKALVNLLIKMLPQPFVESHTGVSNQNLLDTIYDDFAMFEKLLNMYQKHEKTFEKFITIISNFENQQKYNSNDIKILLQLLDEEQLILALTYAYYNSTLYDYFNPEICLKYLEMLLNLLKSQIWSKDKHAFDKTVVIALQRGIQMGLSRWEFYVGLDEVTAEKKRNIWWNLYIFEKARCVKAGQPSLVNDCIMSCLLPKCFRDVGFLDNSDFLARVTEIGRNENFDSMDIQSLIFYGKLADAQIVSDYHIKVLFNERFTSIKNAALPPLLKSQRFMEILEMFEIAKKREQAVRNQTYKLFEIASNPDAYYDKYPKNDVIDAMKFVMCYEHRWSYILSTLQNLEARFNTRENPSKLELVESTRLVMESWRRMNKILLSFDNAYSFSKDFFFYCSIYVFVLPNMTSPDDIKLDDIVENLQVFDKLSVFPILVDNSSYKQVENSHFFKEYCRNLSMTALCARMLIGKYIVLNKSNVIDFIDQLNKFYPQIGQIALKVFDSKSDVYRYLLKPVAKSGFHLKVSNLLSTLGFGKKFDGNTKNGPGNINIQFKPIGTSDTFNLSSIKDGVSFEPENFMKFTTGPRNSINGYSVVSPKSSINSLISNVSKLPNDILNNPNANNTNNNKSVENPINGYDSNKNLINNNTSVGTDANISANNDVNDIMRNQFNNGQNVLLNDELMQTVGFNLGTLDEFVKHSDLNDLYNVLWSDLCPNDIQLE